MTLSAVWTVMRMKEANPKAEKELPTGHTFDEDLADGEDSSEEHSETAVRRTRGKRRMIE
jgi:hypothetical protein